MSLSYRDIHSQLSGTIQPQANPILNGDLGKQSSPVHEKSLDASLENTSHHYHYYEHGQTSLSEHHHSCHNLKKIQLRRFLLPVLLFVFVALGGFLAWSCMPAWGLDLMRRGLDDSGDGIGTRASIPGSKR
jgi:hypothetical protein